MSAQTTTTETESGRPSTPIPKLLLRVPTTLRPRSQSAAAVVDHPTAADVVDQPESKPNKSGSKVVSIPFGEKRGLIRRRSDVVTIKAAFRNIIGKVTSFSDDITTTVIDIKEDTIDISKMAMSEFGFNGGRKSLCKDCQKMSFEECLPGKEPTPSREIYEYIRPLERVILRRDWCSFCRLIFEVLCREENDPLMHPHVQDHIQPSLKGVSFREWVQKAPLIKRMFNSEAVWPFGLSREIPDGEAEVQKLFHPVDKDDESVLIETSPTMPKSPQILDDIPDQLLVGALAATKITLFGSSDSDMSDRDRKILEGLDGALTAAIIVSKNKRKRLPCWVLIKLHTRASPDSGLLAVHVAGHNGEHLSTLAEISKFHLRVATGTVDESESTPTLRYGRILKEKIDLNLANQWLDHCEHHHRCGPLPPRRQVQGSKLSDIRVIDLDKLCLRTCNPENVTYAALSYVWGDYTYAKLDNRTIKRYFDEKALSPERVNLPKAIIDAMEVARRVRLRYLWVDALCIKQDNERDKETQIGQMDRIYANAVVTIVAADGNNANSPLKGVSTTRKIEQVVSEVRPGINVLIPIPTGKSLAPWETRGWTLQEKLLSNRLILFSGGYMTWHCHQVVHFEDMTAKDAVVILGSHMGYPLLNFEPRRGRIDPAPFSSCSLDGTISVVRSKAFEQYATLVTDYTSRGMTYASDVLRGLQGILPTLKLDFGQMQEDESDVFRYGLPQPVLDIALLWQPQGKCERREHCNNCKQSYMPSWSWAGWIGKKNYGKPFKVQTDKNGALVQFVEKNGSERIRPLIRFYAKGRKDISEWPVQRNCKATEDEDPNLSPTSEQGSDAAEQDIVEKRGEEIVEIGLLPLLESDKTGLIWKKDDSASNESETRPFWLQDGQVPEQWEVSNPRSPFSQKIQIEVDFSEIEKWHLVFRTQISQFRVGWHSRAQYIQIDRGRKLTNESDSTYTAPIGLVSILDRRGKEVGSIQVHEPAKIRTGKHYDFIVLSEAQYFGNEDSIAVADYPLYNVMLVSGKDADNVRMRLGLGKLYKHAWKLSNPAQEVVVLG